jgi:hypothetical protein
MDVEVTNITQLTDSVKLAEPWNLLSLQLENDSDAEMDLNNGDGDHPSKDIQVLVSGITSAKWDQDEEIASDGTVLASRIPLLPPTALASDNSRDVPHVVFEGMPLAVESHEDDSDADDSEWLDSASVRADTQSIIAGDSEDEYGGETGEDDNEILSGDEVVPSLRGVPDSDSDVVKE